MATVADFTVSNARQIDAHNWITVQEQVGPLLLKSEWPKRNCLVEVTTQPKNDASEWLELKWSGGQTVLGRPNCRIIDRLASRKVDITASLGSSQKTISIWVAWASIRIITQGDSPKAAVPWSEGAMFTEPGKCGAFIVGSMSMGENARGQVVAEATVTPKGLLKLTSDAKKFHTWKLRREVTSHDFINGVRSSHKKAFKAWVADDSPEKMQAIDIANDKIYDTDGPDLQSSTISSETYNNFRQWLEWERYSCSEHTLWYFKARWKKQKVTLKEVGTGNIDLPKSAHYR